MPEITVVTNTEDHLALRVGLELLQLEMDKLDGTPAIQKTKTGQYIVALKSGSITLSICRASLADAVITCLDHLKSTSVRARVQE